jgi:hypothetical protein
MNYLNRGLCCSVVLMLAVPVSAYASSWSCTRSDHVREVVIERSGDGPVPCSVVYNKPTEKLESQTLWSAENAEGYCEEKAEAFIAKLESWKWTCAQQAEAQIKTDADVAEAGAGEAVAGEAETATEQ